MIYGNARMLELNTQKYACVMRRLDYVFKIIISILSSTIKPLKGETLQLSTKKRKKSLWYLLTFVHLFWCWNLKWWYVKLTLVNQMRRFQSYTTTTTSCGVENAHNRATYLNPKHRAKSNTGLERLQWAKCLTYGWHALLCVATWMNQPILIIIPFKCHKLFPCGHNYFNQSSNIQ